MPRDVWFLQAASHLAPTRRTWRRLLAALAETTPSFNPAYVPMSDKIWRRLLAALADSTPAFSDHGKTDGESITVSESSKIIDPVLGFQVEFVSVLSQRSALRTFVDEFIGLPVADRIMARAWSSELGLFSVYRSARRVDDPSRRQFSPDTSLPDLHAGRMEAAVRLAHARVNSLHAIALSRHDEILGQVINDLREAASSAKEIQTNHDMALSVDGARRVLYSRYRLEELSSARFFAGISVPKGLYDRFQRSVRDLDSEIVTVVDSIIAFSLPAALRSVARDLVRSEELGRSRLASKLRVAIVMDSTNPNVFDLARDIAAAVRELDAAVIDMTGADLSKVDLAGLPLSGVRWTATTRWPTAWDTYVRNNSTEIAPGVFEIHESGTDITNDAPTPR